MKNSNLKNYKFQRMKRYYQMNFNDGSKRYFKELSDELQEQFFVTYLNFDRYGNYQSYQICKPKDKPIKVGKPITEEIYNSRKNEVIEYLTQSL